MKFEQRFSVWFRPMPQKKTSEGHEPIYARIMIDGKRSEHMTGITLDPKFWDDNKERVKSFHPKSKPFNDQLAMIHLELSQCFDKLKATGQIVTPEQVKTFYKDTDQVPLAKRTFMAYMSQYLAITKEKRDAGMIVHGRYKRFLVLYNKLESYLTFRFKVKDMVPAEMKLNFIVGFEHFLKTIQGISHNTAMKCCKDLKQVMNYVMIEEDMPVNRFNAFKCTYKKVKRKYLTDDELEAIEKKMITIPRLAEVRDCFVFSCYTGYSYADAAALAPENIAKGIDGSLWIMRDRGKTGEVENVPLLPKPLAIIEKYRNHPYCRQYNRLLPLNSNVKYNAYLKELGDICGIERDLSTHMARHTCATTVLLNNDVPIETVKEFLGHSDIRTTQIYAKVVQKKLSNDLNDLRRKLESR